MKKINLIRWNNGVGLRRSSTIVADTLRKAGFQVEINGVYNLPLLPYNFKGLRRVKRYVHTKYLTAKHWLGLQLLQNAHLLPIYDINIFHEQVDPMWFPFAHINCFIPNQEWFFEHWRPYLQKFDLILCKTEYAQKIFADLGCKTEFISFTSSDRWEISLEKDDNTYFHLAGKSTQKGTNQLVEVWKNHPDWHNLTIVQHPTNKQNITAKDIPKNINYISDYLDDNFLRKYQNSYGIHLCPSEAEGFGHYIVEAMSCKSLILTTNAPPMNELITESRGILVDYYRTKPQGVGLNYYVDPSDLERKIDYTMGMNSISKKILGENARDWYLENDRFFQQKLVEVIRNL